MHELRGEGDFDALLGTGLWPDETSIATTGQALVVGLLLVIAAAGKSALVPFSGWLPRAMEGPTPSSAVFYGALSVHLGSFLLLRVSPLLDISVAFVLSSLCWGWQLPYLPILPVEFRPISNQPFRLHRCRRLESLWLKLGWGSGISR